MDFEQLLNGTSVIRRNESFVVAVYIMRAISHNCLYNFRSRGVFFLSFEFCRNRPVKFSLVDWLAADKPLSIRFQFRRITHKISWPNLTRAYYDTYVLCSIAAASVTGYTPRVASIGGWSLYRRLRRFNLYTSRKKQRETGNKSCSAAPNYKKVLKFKKNQKLKSSYEHETLTKRHVGSFRTRYGIWQEISG